MNDTKVEITKKKKRIQLQKKKLKKNNNNIKRVKLHLSIRNLKFNLN